ncbi:Rieske (2Fe-2S) protein [Fimbriiglobus ruber]|uniref:Nitrite reductase [NAD(P)H] small subunit n=1 Tax=Fimbriiglobus ruber TaxID=1908690 RepID=A0A225DYH2_9BACT|nr:Rieske 2Fe-2S domain-containing protein [Fimbriiglobus ruber]OWK46411.1 Nitrite reductase [NAD(P)H] small subunit [Fimbriiglobus ruber]
MPTATLTQVKLCVLDDLPEGLGRAFTVGGAPIAVFRTRTGTVLAVDGVCPHKGAPLADGMLAGDQVVCPYHAFKFDTRTGECDQPGTCALKTYPVEVSAGVVVVTV